MTLYNKLWTAIVGTVLLGLAQFLPDNHLDLIEGVKLADMIAGAILVGYLANTKINLFAKFTAQLVAGSAPVALVSLMDGWQTNLDLWPILIALGTAAGVVAIPNPGYQLLGAAPRAVNQ